MLNDAKKQYYLSNTAATDGQLNDLELQWLFSQGSTGPSLMDAWAQFFDANAIPAGSHNDRKALWLQSQGFIGPLADMETKFYADLGTWVARLNGTDQYWDFSSQIPLGMADNCKVSLKLILNRNTTQVIYGGGSSPERFYIGTENGNWLIGNGTDRVDTLVAAPIGTELTTELVLSGGVFKLLVNDSVVYEQPIKYSTSKSLTGISDLSGFRLFGYAYDFEVEVDSVIANSIPLTNKAQGATQLATVGSVNATMVGYDESVWEAI